MDFTTDKVRSLVHKWQTLIEAHVDVKTTDNYTLRMFCIGFTKNEPAEKGLLRSVKSDPPDSEKMVEIMRNQASSCDLSELVAKFIPESIGRETPKFDLGKLTEVHGDYSEDVGVKLDRPAEETVAEGETEVIGA